MAVATILVCSAFVIYNVDSDKYTEFEGIVKTAANDAADAAALFYDKGHYAEGEKVFDKAEGNKAAFHIIQKNLGLGVGMFFDNPYFEGSCSYSVYYIDGNGHYSRYDNGVLTESKKFVFPFQFMEEKTGYKAEIKEPAVIVTIDTGGYRFHSNLIGEVPLRRSSSYKYHGSQ